MSLQVFITLAAVVVAVAAQAPLTVNTPTSAQACLPVQLTWTGGVGPYYVTLIPGGQPGGPILKDFGKQDGNSLTWNVDQPAGTSVSVQIRDSTGTLNYSDKVNVQASSQTCPTGGSTSAGGNSSTTNPPKGGSTSNNSSTPATPGKSGGSTPTASSATTPSTGGSPSSSSPAATAAPASDASRNIPGFVALGLSAAIAIFA